MADAKTPDAKTPDWVDPYAGPLTDAQTRAVAEVNIVVLPPSIVRSSNDRPVANQSFSLTSLNLFKEPHTLETGSVVYGFMKTRGNYATIGQAKSESARIVREQDSKFKILIHATGAWLPITDEKGFIKSSIDVYNEDDKYKNKLRVDADHEKVREVAQKQRELKEETEKLRTSGDLYDDQESLEFYTAKRIGEIKLIEAEQRYIRELRSVEVTLRKARRVTKTLEVEHPEYIDQWVECYNVKRREVGIIDYVLDEDMEQCHNEVSLSDLGCESGDDDVDFPHAMT